MSGEVFFNGYRISNLGGKKLLEIMVMVAQHCEM